MPKTKYELWAEFAAAALGGICGNPESGCNPPSDLANWAASVADAMLREASARVDNLRK